MLSSNELEKTVNSTSTILKDVGIVIQSYEPVSNSSQLKVSLRSIKLN